MPKFAYVAEREDGSQAKGVEKFDTLAEARLALLDRELSVVEITEKTSWTQVEITRKKVKREELMHLSRQLAAFIRAGIPILDAIDMMALEASSSAVREVMTAIAADLRAGERLSDAVDRHPEVFPDYYRGILRSAELTGQLDTVLDQLSRYLERDLEARNKIKAALIYPMAIVLMAIVTVIVLITYVLPKFETFFSSLNAKLPLPTRILLGFGSFVGSFWWLILGALALAALAVVLALRTESGRFTRDRILLRLPAIGDTVRYAIVERFCRILASMTDAGVPLPEALLVATGTTRNLVFERALGKARHAMMEGAGIAGPLARTELFPGTIIQMIRVGEQTGQLDRQLETAAGYFASELDFKIKRLTTMFEPIVITIMGLIVGFVAIALVMAMYGIYNQVSV